MVRGLCVVCLIYLSHGLLSVRESATRDSKTLDGIWNFKLTPNADNSELGFRQEWFSKPLQDTIDMPVPASYNDVTVNASIRDFIGWVWYDREFYVHQGWRDHRIVLRFHSVYHTATVWVNGKELVSHAGGHLPFEVDVDAHVLFGSANRLTVAVNNTLTPVTVPQGRLHWDGGYRTQNIKFDFFNYAGIHRPVVLYTTPKTLYVADVTTSSNVADNLDTATLNFEVAYIQLASNRTKNQCVVELLDGGSVVATGSRDQCKGRLVVPKPNLWWPYLMSESPGHLLELHVRVQDGTGVWDEYTLQVGLRSVSWSADHFLINHKPFYFRGFGRHEDSNFRGKGLDLSLVTRDFSLIRWIGANSFRTSHYPYAEEIMDFADRNGIVVVDEAPAATLSGFTPSLLEAHWNAMMELIARDKNRASVVMWSVANEPMCSQTESDSYFKEIVRRTKMIDDTRPTTLTSDTLNDHCSKHVDIVSVNRYFAWYTDSGHTEVVFRLFLQELQSYRQRFKKPIMVTEYGADTLPGLHAEPSVMFSEEYQAEIFRETFRVFDEVRSQNWFIGEMVWNFADFMTGPSVTRVGGNRKGLFTRDRQPKLAAHIMRNRYLSLAQEMGGTVPTQIRPGALLFT